MFSASLVSILSCLVSSSSSQEITSLLASTTTFLLFASQRASLWSSLLSAIILLHRIQHSTLAVLRHLLFVLLLPPIGLPTFGYSRCWTQLQLYYHFGLFQQETFSSAFFKSFKIHLEENKNSTATGDAEGQQGNITKHPMTDGCDSSVFITTKQHMMKLIKDTSRFREECVDLILPIVGKCCQERRVLKVGKSATALVTRRRRRTRLFYHFQRKTGEGVSFSDLRLGRLSIRDSIENSIQKPIELPLFCSVEGCVDADFFPDLRSSNLNQRWGDRSEKAR